MPKQTPVAPSEAPHYLSYEVGDLKVEFADVGSGVAVIVPEWRKQAVVLTYLDLLKLHALIGAVLART